MKDFTIVYIFPSTDKFVSGLSAVISADWEGQVKVPQCSKSLYIPAYIHKACLIASVNIASFRVLQQTVGSSEL